MLWRATRLWPLKWFGYAVVEGLENSRDGLRLAEEDKKVVQELVKKRREDTHV